MGKGNCEFKGTGGQYFATIFIHLFLISMVSFGIYSAWAWVRLFKLKASHILMNGKQVAFTGTGGQLFMLILIQGCLVMITLGIYGPWAVCKFMDWRARNTLVGGKPSSFAGTGGSFFLLFIVHLVILPILTLGLYYLLGLYKFYAWKEENTLYGGEKTSFGAGLGAFIKVSVISWILNTLTLGLFSPWGLCMLYRWQIQGLAVGDPEIVEHFPPARVSPVIAVIFIIIGLLPVLALALYFKSQFDMHSDPSRVMRIEKRDVKQSQSFKAPVKKLPVPTKPKSVEKPAPKPTPLQKPVSEPAPKTASEEEVKQAAVFYPELKRFDELIEKDSANAEAYYKRAWFFASKGENERALNDYTKAIQLNDRYADAYYNRGLLYSRMKRPELAVNDFSTVIKLDPSAVDAYCNRGNVNYELGRNKAAISDYTTAVKIGRDDADLLYNRGIVYLAEGNKSKAIEDFRAAAEKGQKKALQYLDKLGVNKSP